MKKVCIILSAVFCLLFSGCTGNSSSAADPVNVQTDGSVVEVRDKLFIQQSNDIYNNPDQYKGKTIKLEGIYTCMPDEQVDGRMHHIIYRNAPGCCGNDGQCGFEFEYDGEMPQSDDWIAVEAAVKTIDTGTPAPRVILSVSSLTVETQRGVEFVTN